MALFDRYLIVDWSAANQPTSGKDSIWTALALSGQAEAAVLNHATRSAAMAYLEGCMSKALKAKERLFAGFDFAFGFPIGSADLPGGGRWETVWSWLASEINDADDNCSNRFEVATRLNAMFENGGPFWGHPHTHAGRYAGLLPKKPCYDDIGVSEKRGIDTVVTSAQPVWKLAYTGSVGSQTLLGIARLEKLRRGKFADSIAVWPFQTNFSDDLTKPVVLAEVYPSLFDVALREGEVKDTAQVRTLAEGFRDLDVMGAFRPMLDGPAQHGSARESALTHEAWMVGFSDERLALPDSRCDSASVALDYIRDPAEIYRQSFAAIAAEADLSRFDEDGRAVVTRLIHACGMVDIVGDLEISRDAVSAGRAALENGATIFCDVEMVCHGIIARKLQARNEIICTLSDERVADHAQVIGNTRSAAAVDLWDDRLEGSVVVIGNAPTALFRLLERLEEGAPKPALIIGIPVGFVGAAESKQTLAQNCLKIPFITAHGRRGGSALAASALNAVAAGLSI